MLIAIIYASKEEVVGWGEGAEVIGPQFFFIVFIDVKLGSPPYI